MEYKHVTYDSGDALAMLIGVANNPHAYVREWKAATGKKAVAVMPMNFPVELIAAAGALPVIIQDSPEPITAGNNLLTEFYCGYTRGIADQAARGEFDIFDAFMSADHCIQLIGALDVVRERFPGKPVLFEHLIAAMDDSWTQTQAGEKIRSFIGSAERIMGSHVTESELGRQICAFNENRRILRGLFEERAAGGVRFTPRELRALVKSGMVMDRQEHSALLLRVLEDRPVSAARDNRIRLHLSGHLCHAPKAELLDLFEECGALIVNDDLYTGRRLVSTDMREDIPPAQALVDWYFARNSNVPCPTRVQHSVSWDAFLLNAVETSGAEGVIVLMVKFCEPHMFYYPELRKALNAAAVPHLLIETEHDGLPLETIRTRLESMLERIQHLRSRAAHHQQPSVPVLQEP